jgi:hypothetical protein
MASDVIFPCFPGPVAPKVKSHETVALFKMLADRTKDADIE